MLEHRTKLAMLDKPETARRQTVLETNDITAPEAEFNFWQKSKRFNAFRDELTAG